MVNFYKHPCPEDAKKRFFARTKKKNPLGEGLARGKERGEEEKKCLYSSLDSKSLIETFLYIKLSSADSPRPIPFFSISD